jgi:hypothetical protein
VRVQKARAGSSHKEAARFAAIPAKSRYIEGFLAGQVVAYCERVNTGSGLAAKMAFPKIYATKLIRPIAQEGCKSAVENLNCERVSLWIYRDKLVKRLIDQLQSGPDKPSERDIWSTGKLFGYADRNVLDFIERSR